MAWAPISTSPWCQVPLPVFSSSVAQQIITSFAQSLLFSAPCKKSFCLKQAATKEKNQPPERKWELGWRNLKAEMPEQYHQWGLLALSEARCKTPTGPVYEACVNPALLGLRSWVFAPASGWSSCFSYTGSLTNPCWHLLWEILGKM